MVVFALNPIYPIDLKPSYSVSGR